MYNYIFKILALLLVATVALAAEYAHHGGHGGGHGHGHGHATSSQNYVLHSYHAVPVYYKKSHHGHGHY